SWGKVPLQGATVIAHPLCGPGPAARAGRPARRSGSPSGRAAAGPQSRAAGPCRAGLGTTEDHTRLHPLARWSASHVRRSGQPSATHSRSSAVRHSVLPPSVTGAGTRPDAWSRHQDARDRPHSGPATFAPTRSGLAAGGAFVMLAWGIMGGIGLVFGT